MNTKNQMKEMMNEINLRKMESAKKKKKKKKKKEKKKWKA